MRRLKSIFLLFCSFIFTIPTWAQYTVKGIVKDSKEQFIVGASVVVKSKTDSLYFKGSTTDVTGQFTIDGLMSGEYGLGMKVGIDRLRLFLCGIRCCPLVPNIAYHLADCVCQERVTLCDTRCQLFHVHFLCPPSIRSMSESL